jgi:hypothetical protein
MGINCVEEITQCFLALPLSGRLRELWSKVLEEELARKYDFLRITQFKSRPFQSKTVYTAQFALLLLSLFGILLPHIALISVCSR